MNEFQQAELISNKIHEFIEKQPNDYVALIAQLDRLGKSIMGKYHDKDEHNGVELFSKAADKIEKGVRNWGFENVKIEAMIYNSVSSYLTSELKKKINSKIQLISLNNLEGEGNNNSEAVYYRDGIASNDEDNNGNCGTYIMQEIDDNAISEMVKKELPLIDGDIDLISIEIMEVIKSGEATKQKDIAEVLKLNEREVRNSIDRIKRAGNKVINKLPETEKQEIENYKIDYRMKDIIKNIKTQENIQK
ncbi:MAG: hypothetical protein WC644_01880 [Ignavibacteria bacterium]